MSEPFDFNDAPLRPTGRPKKKNNRHANTSFAYAAICFVIGAGLSLAGAKSADLSTFLFGAVIGFFGVVFQISGWMQWRR